MYALAIAQPWADLTLEYGRLLDDRPRPPPPLLIGARVAIYADNLDVDARPWLEARGLPHPDPLAMQAGMIVGVARVVGYTDKAGGDPWFRGPYAWILANVASLPTPVPCEKQQGPLWVLRAPEEQAVLSQGDFA